MVDKAPARRVARMSKSDFKQEVPVDGKPICSLVQWWVHKGGAMFLSPGMGCAVEAMAMGVRIRASHEARLSDAEEGHPEVMKTFSKKGVGCH